MHAHTHTNLKLPLWQKPKGTQVSLIQDKHDSTAVHSEGNYKQIEKKVQGQNTHITYGRPNWI